MFGGNYCLVPAEEVIIFMKYQINNKMINFKLMYKWDLILNIDKDVLENIYKVNFKTLTRKVFCFNTK